ncbi:hypothetical protein GCM10020001_097180 [Nonomuraea salmonea]
MVLKYDSPWIQVPSGEIGRDGKVAPAVVQEPLAVVVPDRLAARASPQPW